MQYKEKKKKEKKEQQKNQKYPRNQKSEQLFINNITSELPLLFTPLTACFIPLHSLSLSPFPRVMLIVGPCCHEATEKSELMSH